MQVMTMPQAITRKDSQRLGLTFFRMMFEGISKVESAVSSTLNNQLSLTKNDVGNKEDGAGNVVLIPNQAKVLVHALDLCIPDVSSIDMGEKVQDTHNRDEPEINLHVSEVSVTDAHLYTRQQDERLYLSNNLLSWFALVSPHEVSIFLRQAAVGIDGMLDGVGINLLVKDDRVSVRVVCHGGCD